MMNKFESHISNEEPSRFEIKDKLKDPAESAGQFLSEIISEDNPTLLLVSGGSSLEVLDHIDASAMTSNLSVGVLDERFSHDPEENNYLQVLDSNFGQQVKDSDSSLVSTQLRGGDSLEKLADRFNGLLESWREAHPDGTVVAIVGIGTDGHVAGVMPDDSDQAFKDRFENDRMVVGYEVPEEVNQYTRRVTTTMTFFREYLDTAVVFAAGERKKSVIEQLISEELPYNEMPSQILREVDAILFTDQEISKE